MATDYKVQCPTPKEASDTAFCTLRLELIDKINKFGMCNIFVSNFSAEVVHRVIREFQICGWNINYFPSEPEQGDMAGFLSILPPGERPTSPAIVRMNNVEDHEDGQGHTSEFPAS